MSSSTTSCNCKVTRMFNGFCSTLKEGAQKVKEGAQKVQGFWARRDQLPGAGLVSWGSQKVRVGYNNLPSVAAQLKDKVVAVFMRIFNGVKSCADGLQARFFPAKTRLAPEFEPRSEGPGS